MKEICPNCKSERYERINIHSSDAYTGLTIKKFGRIDLNVCRDCGVVYLKREQFEKINKTRPEEIVGSKEYYYHKYNIKEKEEAEWNKEFSNITRTETLEFPTWEEFHRKTYYNKHYGIIFQGKASGCTYQMYEELTPENIIIYDADCQDIVFSKPPTKENYTLACRKCKELFIGKGE